MKAIYFQPHGRAHSARRGRSARVAVLVLVVAVQFTGCTSFQFRSDTNFVDRFFCGWRDHVWAKRAYRLRYPTCESRHPTHFQTGFLAGYRAVCYGEDGYVPAVPPRTYWSFAYQSAQGQEMVDAWFAGYPEGVKAAQQDGAGQYRDVQVSRLIDAALQPNEDAWNSHGSVEVMDQGLVEPVEGDAVEPAVDETPLPQGQESSPQAVPGQSSAIPPSFPLPQEPMPQGDGPWPASAPLPSRSVNWQLGR
jgi:hypothetical protein